MRPKRGLPDVDQIQNELGGIKKSDTGSECVNRTL